MEVNMKYFGEITVDSRSYRRKSRQYLLKGQMDFWVALISLIFLLLPFCIIALIVKLDSMGPLLFKMLRVGELGKGFICYKFRTMVEGAQKEGLGIEVSCDDNRITPVGKLLRKWSLDEIPQLINVLKGEMSLVGPRPALPHQVEKYSEFEMGRLRMKPG
jgi:lipopolysaccharide/colanic/teichoic acid biosynthesis glycosyltransferase